MSTSSLPLISRRLRIVLSLLVLAHLTAVFMPPMAFQSRGPRGLSPSVSMLLAPLSAYGQFLYLDRGYAFFAPDPGPSHLLRVELRSPLSDERSPQSLATEVEVRTYPNLSDQWPRLLYHRHFMLAEFLNDAYQPKLPAEAASLIGPDLSLEELQSWRRGRQRYELIADSMLNHLQSKFENREIKLDRLEHLLPDFVAYADDPTPLDDPPSYIVMEDIPITLEVLLDARPQALPGPGQHETVPVPAGTVIEVDAIMNPQKDAQPQQNRGAGLKENLGAGSGVDSL